MLSAGLDGSCIKRKRQDGCLTLVNAPPVDEARALNQSLKLLGTTLFEIAGVFDYQGKHTTAIDVNPGHSRLRVVEVGQAVGPRVHVTAIETRKAKSFRKNVVERFPIHDAVAVNSDNFLSHLTLKWTAEEPPYEAALCAVHQGASSQSASWRSVLRNSFGDSIPVRPYRRVSAFVGGSDSFPAEPIDRSASPERIMNQNRTIPGNATSVVSR